MQAFEHTNVLVGPLICGYYTEVIPIGKRDTSKVPQLISNSLCLILKVQKDGVEYHKDYIRVDVVSLKDPPAELVL